MLEDEQFSAIMGAMAFIRRLLEQSVQEILSQDKSILLLGPRQTGKTTLLEHQVRADISYTFLEATTRREFELEPDNLIKKVKAFRQLRASEKIPTVLIDEVQKVPGIMDAVQYVIDKQLAKFILTGSSARKLKRSNHDVNMLPGRVIELRMESLNILEMENNLPDLEALLINGSLPEIILTEDDVAKERLLTSYVNIYLEEEVRAEALVRNLAHFSRFLKCAAIDSGKPVNVNNLSEEIGVSRNTINEYYQILEDCLIADRIEPVLTTTSRRRLAKAAKYLFFDLGVRRIAAGEGFRLPEKFYGELFEQFIGLEVLKILRVYAPQARLCYWKNHDGPEVDYVIEYNRQFLPIEVKYTKKPSKGDVRHLRIFMNDYECMLPALVVCRVSEPIEIDENIIAVNWRQVSDMMKQFLEAA